jgi:TonB-dependent SusC/RagA subfamily outer membrane receptor
MYTQNVFKSTFKSKILSSVRMLRVFKLLLLLTLLFFNGADVFAQTNRQVSGTIKDESKESLVGVSIKIKNTNIGTSTDIDGKFKIMASSTDVLQITYIGYETIERVVGNANQIDITMKSSSTGLGEVVVVGYSSKKLEQISSSVSVVSGEKLRDVTSNEVSSLLQGKAAGVLVSTGSGSPTSGSSIVIRGAGSINASTSPLIVVDGNIGGTYNPTDIETITILKDAAATGLYGSRAANGVIIITTKTGKAGTTVMDFNTSVGLSNPNTGNFKLMNQSFILV